MAMKKSFEQVVEEYRKNIAQGVSREDIIARLREDGFNIIEAIRALRELYGMHLGEAKQLVSAHPSWIPVARQAEPLHEAVTEWLLSQ